MKYFVGFRARQTARKILPAAFHIVDEPPQIEVQRWPRKAVWARWRVGGFAVERGVVQDRSVKHDVLLRMVARELPPDLEIEVMAIQDQVRALREQITALERREQEMLDDAVETSPRVCVDTPPLAAPKSERARSRLAARPKRAGARVR